MKRYQRPIEELRAMWSRRAKWSFHPFEFTQPEEAEAALRRLTSYDHEAWATCFVSAAAPHEDQARRAEEAGDKSLALKHYLQAFAFYRLARFPVPSSEWKRDAYRKSLEIFSRVAPYLDPPLERVRIPFAGHPAGGNEIPGYLRLPKSSSRDRLPLVIMWTGTDTHKEDRQTEAGEIVAHGLAVLSVDAPGAGEAPVPAAQADAMFGAIIDWVGTRPDLDDKRICMYGGSFGGYWATKLAHTMQDRITCVVTQGGGVHHNFEPEWNEKMQWGEYPFDVMETRVHMFQLPSVEAWVEFAPKLSLLRSGVLDNPCAPMLIVNGLRDTIVPIEDSYLLLQRGGYKTARLYPNGHMGLTPDTLNLIISWISAQLGCAPGRAA